MTAIKSKTALSAATDEVGNIVRSVYLSPDATMTALVARLESTAEAGLRFMSAMVVHVINRQHPLVDDDKRSAKEIDGEIERAINMHATGKGGRHFAHAWTARLMATAKKIATAMEGDFKTSKHTGTVTENVLRSKTVDDANDVVYNFCMERTKGANNLTAIVKVMNPPKGTKASGKASNNAAKGPDGKPVIKVRADTAPSQSVAARILGETGGDVFRSLPTGKGKGEETAIRLADNVGKGNVDRRVFVMRTLALIDDVALLTEVAEFALNRAKELNAKPAKGSAAAAKTKRTPVKTKVADVSAPMNEVTAAVG